ncbi:protein tyrosine phosphatase [Mycolicibacterium monacense]|nr:protein tyrosine phosphatase [Mycolicibacterium monacense]
MHILFVCTGNICRSPIAERLAVAYARDRVPGFSASSAGTRAIIDHSIHREAALVLEALGGASADFAARRLTAKISADADLILTMTKAHRDRVLEIAPNQLNRTFTLSEAAGLVSTFNAQTIADLAEFRSQVGAHGGVDIPDPIGQSARVFAEIGSQIADLLAPVMELCQRASNCPD